MRSHLLVPCVLWILACAASRPPATAPPEASSARTVSGTWQAGDAASTWTATFEGDALTAIEEKLVQAGQRSTETYAFEEGRLLRYASLSRRNDAQEVVTRVVFGPDGEPDESTRTVDGRDETVDLEMARGLRDHALALAALARGGGTPRGMLLRGRFTWDPAPGPLPTGAVAAVRVEDITLPESPQTLAETTLQVGGETPPVPFELPYDRARLRDGHRYGLRVHVEKDGRPLLVDDRHVPVFEDPAAAIEVTLVRAPERS